MIPKHVLVEIERLRGYVRIKKDRIDKLHRLEKLKKNADLISEYDGIIRQADDTIKSILESKELMEPQKEQVILHSCAKTRLMAQGLKASLCEAEKQIEYLNNSIEDDNLRIKELEKGTATSTGGIV